MSFVSGARGVAIGRGVEATLAAVAAVLAIAYARRSGVGDLPAALVLVALSPLVGEFAMTMAYRYRSDMTVRQALERFLKPSTCDSCSVVLSQWDILPVVPYAVRRGRCSCGRFAVPADCTIVGLLTLAASALIVLGAHLSGVGAIRPLVLFLAFVPAIVSDLVHGEIDDPLLLLPAIVALLMLPSPWWIGPAMSCLLIANLLGSALIARLFVRRDTLSCGSADLIAFASMGLYLDLVGAINATVWFLVGLVLSHAVVVLLGRFQPGKWRGTYGPEGHEAPAAPALPAVVFGGVMGLLSHIWASAALLG